MLDLAHRLSLSALIIFYLVSCGRESTSCSFSSGDTDSDTITQIDSDTESNTGTDSDLDTSEDSDSDAGPNLPPGCEGAITFEDSGLNRVIRMTTGIHSGDIYYEDLQGITSLYISDSG